MEKNKTAVEELNNLNENEEEDIIHSRSAELNDLYNDLLSSLGTKSFEAENGGDSKISKSKKSKTDSYLPKPNLKLGDLLNMVSSEETDHIQYGKYSKDNEENKAKMAAEANKNNVNDEYSEKENEKEQKRTDQIDSPKSSTTLKKERQVSANKPKSRPKEVINDKPDEIRYGEEDTRGRLRKKKLSSDKETIANDIDDMSSKKLPKQAKENREKRESNENKFKSKSKDKSDSSEDDLLKAFGIMDDEVDVDYDNNDTNAKAKNKKRRANAKTGARLKSMRKVANSEYTSREQNDTITANYRSIYASERIKLTLSVICLLLLIYLETAPYLKLPLPFVLDINFYNVVYIWIDVQLLLIVIVLNYKSLIFGIRSFFASSINIYYIPVLFTLLSIIQTIATFNLRYNNPDMVLFNSVTALGMVLISLYNVLDINIEHLSFKAIASKKPKYAMSLNENATLEMESFREIIPEDTVVGNIVKTNFVSNFFSRTYRNKNYGTYEKYFVMIAVPVAFLLFALMLGIKTDIYVALSTIMIILCGSIPLCSVIVSIYPLHMAQKKAYVLGGTMIGANAVNENSDISILSVYDSDIFPPEQIKNSGVRVFGNNRIEIVLQYLRAIFEELNLPVSEVFKSSTEYESGFDTSVSIVDVNKDGICFFSNGVKLFMGSSEYISNIGLAPPVEPNYDDQFEKSSGSILFLSTEWEIISKIYIKYEKIVDFHDIIKNLNSSSICLGIRTFDPNVSSGLLSKITNTKKFPIKVVKLKELSDVCKVRDNISSGIVSKLSLKSFIQIMLLCGKTKNIIKSNGLIQIIAFIMGIGITSAIAITGIIHGEPWQMHSGYIILFHSFWTFIILFLSSVTPNN